MCVIISERSKECLTDLKKKDMKRFIAILLTAAVAAGIRMPAAAASKEKKVDADRLLGLVSEYRNEDGFDVVSMGGLTWGLIKMVANAAADPEDQKALEVLDGLNRFVVVEYEGADRSVRDAFAGKAGEILDGVEKIIEVKEDGETVNIYGTLSKDGRHIKDVVIFVPEDCALLCFMGSIEVDKINEVVKMTNE